MKKQPKDIQMLGTQMTLEGSLVFEGTMIINGHVKGSIESKDGTMVVGEQAVLHADIFVRNAKISGEIRGTVQAYERIELHPPARVYGDLSAPIVLIDAGVIFDGKCTTASKNESPDKSNEIMELKTEGTARNSKPLKKQISSDFPGNNEKGAGTTG